MIKLTVKEKEELLELLYARLDTITDDPSSADLFETERSLTILENKIKNDQEFNENEINWIMEEARNREDIPSMCRLAELLAKHTQQPIITAIQKAKRDTLPDVLGLKTKTAVVETIWSEIGKKDGVDFSHRQLFKYNDGGREEAGYKGHTGDCVCRAICIASGLPYKQVYDALANGNATQRKSKRHRRMDGVKSAGHGINVKRKWFQDYMKSIGFDWIPTMFIGSGCKTHLRGDELPSGKLVITVSKHYTAMIDGVLHDTYDCSRQGTRAVYGYFIKRTK